MPGSGSLAGLTLPTARRTCSISAENRDGSPGGGARADKGDHSTAWASRELPRGWKKSPCIDLAPRSRTDVARIQGPGVIQHVWITVLPRHLRRIVLRAFWDDEQEPSIEVPLGDFFAQGWAEYCPVVSVPITVAPAGGLNSYWQMPFRSAARIEVENLTTETIEGFFYQITWAEQDVPVEAAYLHAQWRRSDPLPEATPHRILDGVRGDGQYVGTYLAWESHHNGWWGEGEVKFYLDSDEEFPSICGTGTEDYVGGAWAFEDPAGHYAAYTTPYLGMPQVIVPDGFARSQQRFGLYRWHVQDPIRFRESLRVEVQALGFQSPVDELVRYKPLRDDIASTALWYQREPHVPFVEDPSYQVPDHDLLDPF